MRFRQGTMVGAVSAMWWVWWCAANASEVVAPNWVVIAFDQPLGVDGRPPSEAVERAVHAAGVVKFVPLFPGHRSDRWSGFARAYLADPGNVWEKSRTLAKIPGVRYVRPDPQDSAGGELEAPNDPGFSNQWSLSNDGTALSNAVAGADIDALAAWQLERGSSEALVAVVDSGINLLDDDFDGGLWVNTGEIAGNQIDDDQNGFVDDVNGGNFHDGNSDVTDRFGHGSNVASIAAARGDNGIGVSGVCPQCTVLPLKSLDDDGYGWYSAWSAAIVYAVDHGATVINISAGGSSDDELLRDAISYADDHDVLVVASMMNTNSDTPYFPAAIPSVIAVGATTLDDTRADPFVWGGGSNFGDHIDLVAPGNLICGVGTEPGDYGEYWSGTSQAAPHVTGTIGLLRSADPTLDREELLQLLIDGAEDRVGDADDEQGWDPYYGYGRLNAANSLSIRIGDPDGDGVVVGDCALYDPEIYPGATDVPDDEIDQDCSGTDSVECFRDADGDGLGDERTISETGVCENGWAARPGDCDDADADVGICGKGIGCAHSAGPWWLALLPAFVRRRGRVSL